MIFYGTIQYMAFHTFVTVTGADAQKYFSGLTANSQFQYSKARRKTGLFSLKKKLKLSERSLLPQIATLWASVSAPDKLLWASAGSHAGMSNGWRAFVQDTSLRLQLGLSVPGTPSDYHLARVGHLSIGGTATEIQIAQYHPSSYFVHHKVAGKKRLYAPVQVTEIISLPFTLGFSYMSNLTATGGSQYAFLYVEVYSSYQGVDRVNTLEIPLNPSIGWNTVSDTISGSLGYVKGYAVFIHIYGYTGDLYFDHVKMIHNSTNWARDKECSNINQTFTNQYYQIPAHWVALVLPTGAGYASDYI